MAVNNLNTGVGIQPTIVDAKGDLIAATANDAVNRLAVGTNGHVLVADSGETTGLKWNNPGSVGGLVHINSTTFSAVASQSINDVFSANHDSYKIICLATCSAGANLLFRVRVGGSDLSGANYNRQSFERSGTTSGGSRVQNQTSFQIGAAGSVETSTITEISNSFATKITDIRSGDRFYSSDNAINPAYFINIGNVNTADSYTGFTIFSSTGVITGSVSVFAYAKD